MYKKFPYSVLGLLMFIAAAALPQVVAAANGVSFKTIDFISENEEKVHHQLDSNLFILSAGHYKFQGDFGIGYAGSAGVTLRVFGNDADYEESARVVFEAGEDAQVEFDDLPSFTRAGMARVQAAVAAANEDDPTGLVSWKDVEEVVVGVLNGPGKTLPPKEQLTVLVKVEGPQDSASYADVQVNGIPTATIKVGQAVKLPVALKSLVTVVARTDQKTDAFDGWSDLVLPPNATGCAASATVCGVFDTYTSGTPFAASMTVKFAPKPAEYMQFSYTERGYASGVTTVAYKTATTSGQFICTGNDCPGKPSRLPVGTTITATMEKVKANPNGNERYVAHAWGGDCAGKQPTEACMLTVGTSSVRIEATHKIEYRVTVKRADENGRIWVNTADSTSGVSCDDASGCAANTGYKTFWFLQDKEIRVRAEGEKGYRFSKWVAGCTDASPGYCTFTNRAATVTAAFTEFRYNLVAAKDCDASGHGVVLDGRGLYCGTMNLSTLVNGSVVRTCGPTCLSTTVALRGGLDTWTLHPERLQDALDETPAECFVVPTQYACSFRYEPTANKYFVSVKDAAGNNAYPVITELMIRYSPRADYDVDPFGANMTIESPTKAASVPSTIDLPATTPGPVAVASSTALQTIQQTSPAARSLVASVFSAWDAVRTTIVTWATGLVSGARQLIAAAVIAAQPASITPYDLTYTPSGAGVGSTINFVASVGNIGGTAYAGTYSAAVLVQQYVNNQWVTAFTATTQGASIPAQQFDFLSWSQGWKPVTAGTYRVQYCLLLITGVDSDKTDNCSAYSTITVNAAYVPPVLPTFKVVVHQEGGGVITSRVNTSDTNFNGCGSACSREFAGGAVLTLIARPEQGKRFVGWGGVDGGLCAVAPGTPNECKVSVWSDMAIDANFETIISGSDTLTLCGDANRSGTLTSADGLAALKRATDPTVDVNAKNTDVNGDGRITATDANLILSAAVKGAVLTGCLP